MRVHRNDNVEPADRNKTPLTHKLTALASAYLGTLGCKPIETEVPVASGWVADVAAYWYPTNTELKYSKLLQSLFTDEAWLSKDKRIAEFNKQYAAPFTILVEVKKDRQDFIRDIDKKFSISHPPANLCYLAYPTKIHVEIEEEYKHRWHFMRNWGLLKCSDSGDRVCEVHAPLAISAQHPGCMIDFIAQVGVRRDHRTAYRFMRTMVKNYRAEHKSNKKYCYWKANGSVFETQCGNRIDTDILQKISQGSVFCLFCGEKVLRF